jgi:hypothetical protein
MDEGEQFQQVKRREPVGIEPPSQCLGVADQQGFALKAQARFAKVDRLDLAVGGQPDGLPCPGDERRRVRQKQAPRRRWGLNDVHCGDSIEGRGAPRECADAEQAEVASTGWAVMMRLPSITPGFPP